MRPSRAGAAGNEERPKKKKAGGPQRGRHLPTGRLIYSVSVESDSPLAAPPTGTMYLPRSRRTTSTGTP